MKNMTIYKKLIFSLIIFTSCNPDKAPFFIVKESRNELVDNKIQIVSQTIKTLRVSDRLPIAVLKKVSNYNNDIRLKYLTGLTKEDGLQDYLLDSIYYDKMGNDTLKRSFVCTAKHWKPTQIFRKKFRENNQVAYYMTERPFNKDSYYKKEIYYKYNADGQILSETECESTGKTECDSISKKEYIYSSKKKLDKKILFIWKDNKWKELEKNSR
ncbi:MAG TPA: hypothetical protein VFK73_05265 [Paludibacter sp.]|nr:hypothetical protein [Paludibacter sp.]